LGEGKISQREFEEEKKRQRNLFEKQIDFAMKNNLPLILHVRSFDNSDAH
jgi:Tat protein secretion system quality control protein TatD with DNase activity